MLARVLVDRFEVSAIEHGAILRLNA